MKTKISQLVSLIGAFGLTNALMIYDSIQPPPVLSNELKTS
jgi:hypothetical protein